jgi:hypothetical protein
MCTDSFRARLGDDDLAAALRADATTTKAQHAAEEITKRIVEEIDRGGAPRGARVTTFYPGLVALARMPDAEKRKAAAWAMQFDRKEPSFDAPLRELLDDKDPDVARNAAEFARRPCVGRRARRPSFDVASLRHQGTDGRQGGGHPPQGRPGRRGASHRTPRAREGRSGNPVADRRPCDRGRRGRRESGEGDVIASVLSQASALHAMQALVLPGIGRREDAEAIERFLDAFRDADGKVLDQAKAAIAVLKQR